MGGMGFRVGNGATAYSHSDETGRRNLWVTLPAKATSTTVQVAYLPGDPWVNSPVSVASSSSGSALTGLGTGVLLVRVGLFFLVSDIRSRSRKRSPRPE